MSRHSCLKMQFRMRIVTCTFCQPGAESQSEKQSEGKSAR